MPSAMHRQRPRPRPTAATAVLVVILLRRGSSPAGAASAAAFHFSPSPPPPSSVRRRGVVVVSPFLSAAAPAGGADPPIPSEDECWSLSLSLVRKPYVSSLLREMDESELDSFLEALDTTTTSDGGEGGGAVGGGEEQQRRGEAAASAVVDPLWEQVKLEALSALEREPQAGPQLYSLVLSRPSLPDSLCTVIANEIETELIPATAIKNLFLELLEPADHMSVSFDVMAAAMRSPSVGTALNAVLFDRGVHALVCYRVGHRLWNAGRKGLAYYMQSTVSTRYSSDIHPACVLGSGIYLKSKGVVIGETAVVGDDVSILQGVTLGGTGKEAGDRHPKVGSGVILHDSATVLGNIPVGDGAVVTAKSIVTKPVPPLARVSGVPAKIRSYRDCGSEFSLLPDENAYDVETLGGEGRRAPWGRVLVEGWR